ncbi:MAG: hypothetical protein ACR2RV_16025 [Verrucomicrobiales bacterium]
MKTEAAALEQKLEGHVHPPTSNAAQLEAKALAALATLLDSEDELIRLEAAQAILNRHHEPTPTSKAVDVVKKVSTAL